MFGEPPSFVGRLPKISYKPGWEISYQFTENSELMRCWKVRIQVKWLGTDSVPPHNERPFHSTHEHNVADEAGLKDAILKSIEYCELHEAREWLRFDGVVYRDPHEELVLENPK